MGWNARYGSLVLANINGLTALNTVQASPYMEYLFFDTSGRGANMPHYRVIPEIYLADRGTGVYQAIFSITGQTINGGVNSPIRRFWNATGFMGPYSGSTSGINTSYPWTGLFTGTGPSYGNDPLPSGVFFSGVNPQSNLTGTFTSGTYGYGGVYGIIAPNSGWYGLPFDCCLLDNPVWSGFSGENGMGATPSPTGETGLLCWPYYGAKIGLAITGMKYTYPNRWATAFIYDDSAQDLIGSSGCQLVADFTGVGGASVIGASGAGTYIINGISVTLNASHQITASTVTGLSVLTASGSNGTVGFAPTNFKKPQGRIHHVEFFSGSGMRLLPNYASGDINFSGANTYSPIRGGALPGLSSQNGMQLYFDFIWSA